MGNGLLGDGFSFDVESLLGLASHLIAPMLGGILSARLFALVDDELASLLDALKLSSKECFGSFLVVLVAIGVGGSGSAFIDFAAAIGIMAVLDLIYSINSFDFFPSVSAFRAFGDGLDALGFAKKLGAQSLGALCALLLSSWLFDGTYPFAVPASVGEAVANGTLFGLYLSWSFKYAKGSIGFALIIFTTISSFGSFNSAALLSSALLETIGGGGVGSFTDPIWIATLAAPLLGGVLAGRLPALIGV